MTGLLVDDQNFKRGGDVKKTEDQISRGGVLFFFFVNQNLSHFDFVSVIPVSPNTTSKEKCLG